MKVTLSMDNGSSVSVDVRDADEFLGQLKNSVGVLVNGFMKLAPNIYINPSHISTIQVQE